MEPKEMRFSDRQAGHAASMHLTNGQAPAGQNGGPAQRSTLLSVLPPCTQLSIACTQLSMACPCRRHPCCPPPGTSRTGSFGSSGMKDSLLPARSGPPARMALCHCTVVWRARGGGGAQQQVSSPTLRCQLLWASRPS